MSVLLLLISFIAIFLNLWVKSGAKHGVKNTLIRSVLLFSAVLVGVTEIASTVQLVNFWFFLMFWTGITLTGVFLIFLNRSKTWLYVKVLWQNLRGNFGSLNLLEKIGCFSILLILAMVFVQGIIYPPNNYDSMTYHLARISHWISQQSVAHYPTHIFRQIYQPPFSEFAIMQVNILSGGDYFSNSLQFFFLIFSMVVIVSIVESLGLNRRFKLVAIILLVTIPNVILQASSTQNDIVVSFFILTSIYFVQKSVHETTLQNYLFAGLSFGLGFLTKGTAYLYLAPVILVFAITVLSKLVQTKNPVYLRNSVLAAMLCVSINLGHFIRNDHLTNNILGVDDVESKTYSNEKMTPLLFLSNVVKNIGLHTGTFPIQNISDSLIYQFHSIAGVDINNSGTNFYNMRFGSRGIPTHEDMASNPIHLVLIFFSLVLIFLRLIAHKNRTNRQALLLCFIFLLQGVIFCLYLKWQPWHTRLHVPMFMLAVPLICYAASLNARYYKALIMILPLVILYASVIVVFNCSRPLISIKTVTLDVSVSDTRFKKYFANRPGLYEEYQETVDNLKQSNFREIGVVISGDDWEYPLFCQFYDRKMNPVHLNVPNITKNIPQKIDHIDCIVSTTVRDTIIQFNGKTYHNQDIENKVIWFYR